MLCHLVAREFTIKWQHLIFIIIIIMYIVQLYKEDWGILCMLGYQACSPDQYFQLSSANTTQTIGELFPKITSEQLVATKNESIQ